jgi:hypothetical protein
MDKIKKRDEIVEFILRIDKVDNKYLTLEELNFKHFLLTIKLDHEVEQENFLKCSQIKKDIDILKEDLKNGKS